MVLPIRIYEEHNIMVKSLLGRLEMRLALLEWELRINELNKLNTYHIAGCNLLHQNLTRRWQFQKHMSNAVMHWLETFETRKTRETTLGSQESYRPYVAWVKARLHRQIDISMSLAPRFDALPRRLDNLSSAVSSNYPITLGFIQWMTVLQRNRTTRLSAEHGDREKFCQDC